MLRGCDCVKRPHDCSHVLVKCSIKTASPLPEVTWSKCFAHDRDDARCDRDGVCPTFVNHRLDGGLNRSSRSQPRLYPSVLLFLGHPCDSHVRCDLSHSISPHRVVVGH